ncbi:MAG: hypothetical protein OXG78_10740 [Chloroflexi bacterium]|nr:hypothetical protein [Chloroflexota bacterium]
MRKAVMIFALTLVSITSSAQEWIEHEGIEYNCDSLNAILDEYGDHDFARIGNQMASVRVFFTLIFPLCPLSGEAVDVIDESDEIATVEEASDRALPVVENSLYHFNSVDDGQRPVLGPITLPKGLYRFTAVTDDRINVRTPAENDDCGRDFLFSLIDVAPGLASFGLQELIEVESDCEIMLKVQVMWEAWTLDIESVEPETEPTLSFSAGSLAFDSDEAGYQPVLGPVAFAAGSYRVSVTTEDFFIVRPYPLSDDCGRDLDWPLIKVRPGEASRGVEALVVVESDCSAFLDIEWVDEEWAMDIEKLN